jgi:hypothetical protein
VPGRPTWPPNVTGQEPCTGNLLPERRRSPIAIQEEEQPPAVTSSGEIPLLEELRRLGFKCTASGVGERKLPSQPIASFRAARPPALLIESGKLGEEFAEDATPLGRKRTEYRTRREVRGDIPVRVTVNRKQGILARGEHPTQCLQSLLVIPLAEEPLRPPHLLTEAGPRNGNPEGHTRRGEKSSA